MALLDFLNYRFTLRFPYECITENGSNLPLPTLTVYLKIFLAEYLGSFFFLFLGCCTHNRSLYLNTNEMTSAIIMGIIFGTCLMACFPLTYGHLNPSFTICFFIFGFISLMDVLVYILGQFLGAISGCAFYKYLSEQGMVSKILAIDHDLCATLVNENIGPVYAFIWEFLGTIFLVLVLCSVIDPRNGKETYPLKMAMALGSISIGMAPYTGASMNTARSFAPALINNFWDHHWVYWAGPILGSVFGSLFYYLVFMPVDDARSKIRPNTHLVAEI